MAKKPEANSEQGFITLDTAAKLVMLTPRRVQQLAADGYISRKDGKYTIVGVVQGYIRYLQEEDRRTAKSAAESRVRDRRADEIELRILEKQGTLLEESRAEALGLVDVVIGGLKADLYAIPARTTTDIGLRRKIEEEIDNALGEAAKRAKDCAAGVGAYSEAT